MRINKSIKIFMTIGIVLLPLILSSCWDKKEINERAFVNTLYIDKNYARTQSEFISSDLKKRDDERLFVSFGIANASEGETRLTTFVHSATGVSLGNIVEKLNGEITRTPFFGHTKLIVLGKGLLGEPELLSMVLDGLEREMSIGRELKIIASESSNVTLEDLRPNIETLYSSYIVGVMEQSDSISYTIPMNMGEFFNDIRKGDGRAILPVVRIKDNILMLDKMALIDKYKLKEMLGPGEIAGYKLFHGLKVNMREYIKANDVLTTLRISDIKRSVYYSGGGNVPKFLIKYSIEGDVTNYKFAKQIFNDTAMKKLQDELKKHLKVQLTETTDFFQNKIKIDYLGLGDYVKKFHPIEYKKYKNWDKAFESAEISFDINLDMIRLSDSK